MPKLTTWNPNSTLQPRQGVRATTLAERHHRDRLYDRLDVRLAAHDALQHLRAVGVHDLGCGDLLHLMAVEDAPRLAEAALRPAA